MILMSALCLYCITHLWTGPKQRTWIITAAMYGGMVLMHIPFLVNGWTTAGTPATFTGHHSGHQTVLYQNGDIDLGMVGLMLLSLIQVWISLGVLRAHRDEGAAIRETSTREGAEIPSS
ncbi:hypothetical protein QF036_002106 [Arthrobacter globiformis]|nr:hypothetical protein [Arthrobacter globiformis]